MSYPFKKILTLALATACALITAGVSAPAGAAPSGLCTSQQWGDRCVLRLTSLEFVGSTTFDVGTPNLTLIGQAANGSTAYISLQQKSSLNFDVGACRTAAMLTMSNNAKYAFELSINGADGDVEDDITAWTGQVAMLGVMAAGTVPADILTELGAFYQGGGVTAAIVQPQGTTTNVTCNVMLK